MVMGLSAACSASAPQGSSPVSASPGASGFALEVRSPSGQAVLGVPEGAPPAGLDPTSIKISEPDIPAEFADSPLLAAFELEPDGTSFLTPVTLTVKVDQPGATLPEMILVAGDAGELLETTVEVDPVTGAAVVSAPIAHFSTVVVYSGNIKAQIVNSGDHPVGVPFDVSVTISRTHESLFAPFDETIGSTFENATAKALNAISHAETFGPVTIGTGDFSTSGLLSPGFVVSPDSDITIDNDAFTFSQRFVCVSPGVTRVVYNGRTKQQVNITLLFFVPNRRSKVLLFEVKTHPFNCTDSVPTPTPSPSPSPSPSPPPSPTMKPFTNALFYTPLGISLFPGDTFLVEPHAVSMTGEFLDWAAYRWTSSDPSVLSVEPAEGFLRAVAPGSAIITAEAVGLDAASFAAPVTVVAGDFEDCPPDFSGSIEGLLPFSDAAGLSDRIALPADAAWQTEAADGTIRFFDGPPGFEMAEGAFFNGCNILAEGRGTIAGVPDVLFRFQGSVPPGGTIRLYLVVASDGALGLPPAIYSGGSPP